MENQQAEQPKPNRKEYMKNYLKKYRAEHRPQYREYQKKYNQKVGYKHQKAYARRRNELFKALLAEKENKIMGPEVI